MSYDKKTSHKLTQISLIGIILILIFLMFTSCSSQKTTPKYVFPTYKQWKSLNKQELKIVNDYAFKDGYIDSMYLHLDKIKFNKKGRAKLKKIYSKYD